MFNRILIIGTATLMAALVLYLAMRADPVQKTAPVPTIDTPLDPSAFTGVNPKAGSSQFDPRGQADKYRINRLTDSGQLIEFFGDRITPLPKGVAEVTAPGARIHLAEYRVLQITADQGTIVAPDNQPQSGRFTGNVIITLFESPPSRRVDLTAGSDDIALRASLGDSRFDLELGLIESNDPVHVTSPQLDFRGTGLTLNYNERRRRIDRLEIHQGRSLRFKPETHSNTTKPISNPDKPQNKHTAPANHETQAKYTQRYRASFTKRVTIKTPQAQINADRFEIVFNFNAKSQSNPLSHRHPQSHLHHLTPLPNKHPAAAAFAYITASTSTTTSNQSMAPVDPEDIIITWAGPLIVEPDTQTILPNPKDALVELYGQPLTIATPDNDRISAATLEYLTETARLRLSADNKHKIEINSPSLGQITAENLVINQANNTGQITGPATLLAGNTNNDNLDSNTSAINGLNISWQDNLDLSFASKHDQDDNDTFTKLAALDTADFHGRVILTNPNLDLQCDRLTVAIDNSPNLSPAPSHIRAQGGVQLTARDLTAHDDPLELKTNQLQIQLDRDSDHHAQPNTILATGKVDAHHSGRRIRAEQLVLNIEPAKGSSASAISLLTAEDNVRIDVTKPQISVTADRLTADLAADQIELFASAFTIEPYSSGPETAWPDPLSEWSIDIDQTEWPSDQPQPVRIAFEQGVLQAEHIVMHHRSESMHVPGPGILAFAVSQDKQAGTTKSEPRMPTLIEKAIAASRNTSPSAIQKPIIERAATATQPTEQQKPDDHTDRDRPIITLAWNQAMHLDNRTGVAHFIGNVITRSISTNDFTELIAADLRLEFVRLTKPTSLNPTPVDNLAQGTRIISTATARENVILHTQRFDKHNTNSVQTRLRLQGQHIVFDNVSEQAQVLGQGSLLFEDYRLKRTSKRAASSTSNIKLTGQGPTLFQWSNQMTIDAAHNDIELQGNVQMIHRPTGQKPIQLDCRRLLADLKPTGGLPSWLTGSVKQPTIQAIQAENDVRLSTADRSVQTDKLLYTGQNNTVMLRANPGRLTLLHEYDEPYVHSAQAFSWNLTTDRIEIDNPNSPWIPLRSTRRN